MGNLVSCASPASTATKAVKTNVKNAATAVESIKNGAPSTVVQKLRTEITAQSAAIKTLDETKANDSSVTSSKVESLKSQLTKARSECDESLARAQKDHETQHTAEVEKLTSEIKELNAKLAAAATTRNSDTRAVETKLAMAQKTLEGARSRNVETIKALKVALATNDTLRKTHAKLMKRTVEVEMAATALRRAHERTTKGLRVEVNKLKTTRPVYYDKIKSDSVQVVNTGSASTVKVAIGNVDVRAAPGVYGVVIVEAVDRKGSPHRCQVRFTGNGPLTFTKLDGSVIYRNAPSGDVGEIKEAYPNMTITKRGGFRNHWTFVYQRDEYTVKSVSVGVQGANQWMGLSDVKVFCY